MKALVGKLAIVVVALAACLMLTGCPERISDLDKLIKDGDDYFSRQKYDDALVAYSKAIELSPDTAGVWVNRGNCYTMKEENDKALADYNEAIRIDDKLAVAYANRGILLDNQEDWRGALADYRKVLALNPELAEAPSVWKRILYNKPTENILDRMNALEQLEKLEQQGQTGETTTPEGEAAKP